MATMWQQNEDNARNTISNLSTMNNDNSNDPCQTTMKIHFNGTKVRQSTLIDNDRVKRARKCHSLERKVSDIQTDNEKTVPGGFICPLTMEVMLDPVLDGEGNTFERSSLIQWLKQSPTSPVSRQPLSERMVTANNALRETIHEFMGSEWVLQRTIAEELKTGKNREDNDKYMCTNAVSVKEVSRMRAKIDCFLQNTCKEIGGIELKLNADGCCAFRYDTITIVLDVPENVGVFCLYTKDLIQGISKLNQDQLCRRAMELNFLQGDTRGGCLSVRSTNGSKEIMFNYTDRVAEVSARDFTNILLNFVETAVNLREKLMFGIEPQHQWWEDIDDDEVGDDGEEQMNKSSDTAE